MSRPRGPNISTKIMLCKNCTNVLLSQLIDSNRFSFLNNAILKYSHSDEDNGCDECNVCVCNPADLDDCVCLNRCIHPFSLYYDIQCCNSGLIRDTYYMIATESYDKTFWRLSNMGRKYFIKLAKPANDVKGNGKGKGKGK
jgi:hypothetical protein